MLDSDIKSDESHFMHLFPPICATEKKKSSKHSDVETSIAQSTILPLHMNGSSHSTSSNILQHIEKQTPKRPCILLYAFCSSVSPQRRIKTSTRLKASSFCRKETKIENVRSTKNTCSNVKAVRL